MGIITSNAWLDVNYGYVLQKLFCDHFRIVAILESRCEPWFTEASVNTVFTIVERCKDSKDRDGNLVKFVKVKKPLCDLVPGDPQIKPVAWWNRWQSLVERIESAGLKNEKTVPLAVVSEEDEDFRIRVCRQSELRDELMREQKTVKWGRLLRAPDVYFDMLCKGRFCLLRELAIPKRGGTTRVNDFFHVTPKTARRFGIEDEYLLPLIKSPKDSSRIPIDMSEIDLRILVCRRSKSELKKLGQRGVMKYIEWGETQTYARGEFQGLPWPEGTWVAKRQPAWYALPTSETNTARVFFAQAFGDKHMHRYCSQNIIADARLYFLEPRDKVRDNVLSAILNSSLCALGSELAGRVTMGDGVLELKVEDARDYLLVPDIRNASAAQKKLISAAFETLCKREIGNVFEEVMKKDRQALDAAVLIAIGLDSKKFLKPIYDALCELVRDRISLGEKRGKIRKTKTRKAIAEKESLQEVLNEHLPGGPKKFPEDFLSYDAAKSELIQIPLPDKPMRLEMRQLMMTVLVGRDIFREVKSPAEGKYLLYCQQAGQTVARLPEKLVEVSRTVANYEGYLRDLRKTLYEACYRRTLDVALSERLTQAVFDRFRLPKIISD